MALWHVGSDGNSKQLRHVVALLRRPCYRKVTLMNSPRTFLASIAVALSLSAGSFPAVALDDLLITEFMAQNDHTLADEDGAFADWIEIYNAGSNTVNLAGWYLTDTPDNPGTWWRFPATNLTVNSYIVFFASGKDTRIPARRLHT